MGAAGGAWGQAGEAGSSGLQQPQVHLQPQGPAPWRQQPLRPGAPGPCHAYYLQLVGTRPRPPTPQLQGAEAREVMHAEEPWSVAMGNDIADPSPQALQSWPQLQDVLSPAQAGEVQAQGQRGFRVEAGQAHLWTKTRQVLVRGGENQNAVGRGRREELPESFPVPRGRGGCYASCIWAL